MPKTPQQYNDIRVERQNKIKEVSLKLFAENSYAHTTIAHIAQEAGISKGLIYNYFESKQAILEVIIDEFVHLSFQFFDPNNDGILTVDEFFYYLSENFSIIKKNPKHWKLYYMVSLQIDVMKIMLEKLEKLTEKVGKIFYEFFNEHFGDKSYDEIVFLTSFMKGAILQFVVTKDEKMFDVAKRLIVEHFKQKLT